MSKALVITDEKKSSINQCNALINEIKKKKKLNVDYRLIRKNIINHLPNSLLYLLLLIRSLFKKNFACSYDMIISCGRVSAPYSLILKKNGNCRSFHILDPYFLRSEFDGIIIPKHDLKKIKMKHNLIVTDGALVDKKSLSNVESKKFRKIIPYNNVVSCFIGGDGKSSKISLCDIEHFIEKINTISKTYKVIYCFSRRTKEEIKKKILDNKLSQHMCFYYKALNPYWFLIENSRYFIVTEDSVSMISDAVTTGKPVYIIPIRKVKKKIKIFNDSLRERGITREFNGKVERWKYKPLNESVRVSKIICETY